jgi:hypothetical protein
MLRLYTPALAVAAASEIPTVAAMKIAREKTQGFSISMV